MANASLVNPEDFPASRRSCYLNAASTALMLNSAAEKTLAWQKDLAENGTMHFDERAEEGIFDDLHDAAAELLNADASDIAAGSSATELLTSLAWAILPNKGQEIIGTDVAHPSTVYPWQRVARCAGCKFRMAGADSNGYVDPEGLLSMINERAAIVVLSHVEYRSGQKYDLGTIAQTAHQHGAYLVVDATQSAGQVPINVKEVNVDAIVSSGYKWLCGPFGAAFMYLAPSLQARLDPGVVGWRSHRNMWEFRADRLEYSEIAKRFEASTTAYGCAIGLAEAIGYLNRIGVVTIFDHNIRLADQLAAVLKERGARVHSPEKELERSSIITVDFPGRNAQEIVARLNANRVVVSYRMGAIRISPHLYNNTSDIEEMTDVINGILG